MDGPHKPLAKIVSALYRAAQELPSHQFEDCALRLLVPLLTEVLAASQATQPRHELQRDDQPNRFIAISDQTGHLFYAEAGFLKLLHKEFPRADEHQLPTPIIEPICELPRRRFVGHRIVCEGRRTAGMLLHCMRARSAIDDLTPPAAI